MNQKTILIVMLAALLIVPVLAVAQTEDTSQPPEEADENIVARVNEEVITRQSLSSATQINQILQTLLQQFSTFGQVLFTTPEGDAFLDVYRRHVLDQIVNSRLLVQLAEEEGISANEADVEDQVNSQIDQIMQQNQLNEQQLKDALEQQGSSLEEYRDTIRSSARERLMVQGLQQSVVDNVTVPEEEIATYYEENQDEFTDEEGHVSPLSDVRDQIQSRLLQKAQSDRWTEWFSQAKEDAQIEILL